jgi:hypothetical protein
MTFEKKHSHSDEISFDNITRSAKENTLRDGKHNSLVIIEGSKDLLFREIPVLPADVERTQFMRMAGNHEAKSGEAGHLRQVFLVSEGWISLPKEGELSNTLPSQDPNRKEVLVVSGLKIQGQVKNIKLFEMIRNDQGKLVDLQAFLPGIKEGEMDHVFLLEAFYEGFQNAFSERLN